MMRKSGQWTTVSKDPHLKNAASASRHDSQETEMLDEDSERSLYIIPVNVTCLPVFST